MEVTLKELVFERREDGSPILGGNNMELLLKYVIPIIENNPGWGVTVPIAEDIQVNPEKWQMEINSTVGDKENTKVFIAMDGERPVGLLEYQEEETANLLQKDYRETLTSLISQRDHHIWDILVSLGIVTEDVLDDLFPDLKEYIYSKKLYKGIGVVLIPELQGKKSGVSDILYRKMSDGFLFGWTSSPQAVAKRRKLFPYTLFFPLLDEKINSIQALGCLSIVAAYIKRGEMLYGVEINQKFVKRDKEETMRLVGSFLEKGKITEMDYKRLDYILGFKQAQSAIVSV